MSNAGLGTADLEARFITTKFRSEVSKLEKDLKASYGRSAKAAEDAFGGDIFKASISGAKAFEASLKPIRAEIKGIVSDAEKLGGAFSKGGGSKAVRPLTDDLKKLQGGVTVLQQKLELGEVAEREFTEQTRKLQAEMREALKGTQDFSREQVALYRALGQSERGLKTVAGETTRFGIAQQTAIGINRTVLDQLGNFGPVGQTAVMGIDAMGGSLAALPVAGTLAAGAIGGVVLATGALVQRGKPHLEEYQRAMNILAESGEKDLGRFRNELTELQEEGGRAAQAFSRSQLAGALAETVKAGTSASEAMTLLKTGTKLASAENQDLSQSTALVLQNLRQFGLGVEDASRAGDALAAAGNVAAGSAADLSNGLSTVGPVAKAAGLSLEETLGLLVALDNKGLSAAEEGATGLRSVLSALADPTKEARGVFEQLGISLEDVDGNARPAADVLADLKAALNGSETAMASAAKIFDTQGITTILALDESTEGYTRTILEGQGALESYADTMANGVGPAEARAKAAMDDLATTAAEFFAPAIAGVATALTELIRGLDTFFSRFSGRKETETFTTQLEEAQAAVGTASDKKSLLGALEELSKHVSNKGKKAIDGYAERVRAAKGDFSDLKDEVVEGIGEMGRAELELRKGQLQREINVQARLNTPSPQEVEQALTELESRINRSADQQKRGFMVDLGVEFDESLNRKTVKVLNDLGHVSDEAGIQIFELGESLFDVGNSTDVEPLLTELAEVNAALAMLDQQVQETSEGTDGALGGTGEGALATAAAFDIAAASVTELKSRQAELQKQWEDADPGTEAERAARAQLEAVEAELEARDRLRRGREAEVEVINRATTATRNLGIVSTDVVAAQKQLQDTLLASGGRDITPAATAIGPNYELAESAKQAGKELRTLRADVREHAIETRESAEQSAALDAVLKQLARDIGQTGYREAANNLDLYGEKARIARENQQALARSFREAKQSAADYNTTTRLTEAQTNALAEVFGNVRNGLKEAEAEYRRTGDAQAFAQTATGLYQDALTTLREQGFDALNPAVQEYLAKLNAIIIESGNAETASLRLADAAETLSSKFDSEGVDAYMRSLARQDIVTFAGNARSAGEAMRFLSENGIVPTQYHLEVLNEEFGETGVKAEVAKTKAEALADTFGNAVEIFSAVTEGAFALADALGVELPESFSIVAEGVEGLGGALQKALSGDVIGAIVQGLTTLFDVIASGLEEANRKLSESGDAVEKYGLAWLKANGYIYYDPNAGFVVDTAALAEYEQRLAAIEKHGQAVADRFTEIDDQGRITFNEDALSEYEQGMDRLTEATERFEDQMREVKDAVDSVQDAQLSADEATFEARLDSQDGAYSVNDIFEEQRLAIGRAAQARDEAYAEAARLDAAGQSELANQLRSAADQTYQAELTTINNNATDRAEAIGKNSAEFQNALTQNGDEAGRYWTEYWNADAAAQLEAQKQAQIQLRRFEHVLNSQRYADLLNAGYSEAEAWRIASAELGYTIDETSGNLIAATDQAGQAQGAAAQNAGTTTATGITTGWQAAVGAAITGSSNLTTQLAGSQGVISSAVAALFGNSAATVTAQGGTLAGALSGIFGTVAGAAADGSSLFNTTLTNGANLNLGTISSVTNALGGAIVGGGNALAKAELDKANQLIKQKQEGAKKEAGAEISNGNELNKVVTGVSDLKIAQIKAATDAQSNWIGKAFDGLIGQVIAGNKGLADAWSGKGTHWSSNSKPHWSSGMTGGTTKLIQDAFKAIDGNFNADWAKPIDPEKFKEQQEKKLGGGKDAPAPKGSIGHIDDQLAKLRERYNREKDPKKRAQLARQIKALEKQRDKMDVLAGGNGKGSGSSGGKGSSGSGKDIGPKGSPSYIQEQIRKLDEQIGKTANQGKIRQLQAKKEKLEKQLETLLGTGKDPEYKPGSGSVDYVEELLAKARDAYNRATNDKDRAAAAERVRVLEAELKEKRKLLEDATKDVQDAVKGQVISIESPIADLGMLAYLADQISTTASRIPSSVASASSAGASSITRLPDAYTTSILPSYQEQMEASTTFKTSVQEFRLGVNEFRAAVREFRTSARSSRSTSTIAQKARGEDFGWDMR